MVRVASLMDMVNAGYEGKKGVLAGMTAKEQISALSQVTHELVAEQYGIYNKEILPGLLNNGLRVIKRHEELTGKEAAFVDKYYEENVYPVLTPMAVDSSRPFPLIRNKTLNIGALVRKKNGEGDLEFATVQVPGVLDRIVQLPAKEGAGSKNRKKTVILLEEIIERNIHKLFMNYDIVCSCPFRIMTQRRP